MEKSKRRKIEQELFQETELVLGKHHLKVKGKAAKALKEFVKLLLKKNSKLLKEAGKKKKQPVKKSRTSRNRRTAVSK